MSVVDVTTEGGTTSAIQWGFSSSLAVLYPLFLEDWIEEICSLSSACNLFVSIQSRKVNV